MAIFDQSEYEGLINEIKILIAHLKDAKKDLPDEDNEAIAIGGAISAANDTRRQLNTAKERNAKKQVKERDAKKQVKERDALIKRIKTGTTTEEDAILAEKFMS